MFTINDFSANQSLVDSLYSIDNEYPWRKDDFYKSLSQETAEKIFWVGEVLKTIEYKEDKMNIYAGGFCFYESVLLSNLNLKQINLYDYDPTVKHVNWKVLQHLKKDLEINQICLDVVLDSEYIDYDANILINTSCELMYDMKHCANDYSKDTLMIFQGTNCMARGNINVHEQISDFIDSLPKMDILYAKTRNINYNNRYMVIGRKL